MHSWVISFDFGVVVLAVKDESICWPRNLVLAVYGNLELSLVYVNVFRLGLDHGYLTLVVNLRDFMLHNGLFWHE